MQQQAHEQQQGDFIPVQGQAGRSALRDHQSPCEQNSGSLVTLNKQDANLAPGAYLAAAARDSSGGAAGA